MRPAWRMWNDLWKGCGFCWKKNSANKNLLRKKKHFVKETIFKSGTRVFFPFFFLKVSEIWPNKVLN